MESAIFSAVIVTMDADLRVMQDVLVILERANVLLLVNLMMILRKNIVKL